MTMLIFSAASSILSLVFRTHGREAAVPSGPAEAGQKLVLEALRMMAIDRSVGGNGDQGSPSGLLDPLIR